MKSFNLFSNRVKALPILLAFLTVFAGSAWGALTEAYSYTFTAKQFEDNTTAKTLGTVTWTPATSWSVGTGYWGYDGTKGQQWGSGSHTLNSMTITSGTSFTNVKKITVNGSIASNGGCTLSVKVGGTAIGTSQSLTTTATAYDFESSGGLTGTVSITLSNGSKKKAQYIKSITIYTESGGGCDKKVTVSKGSESHGTFSLDKTGALETCSGLTVTVTDITPTSGYKFDHIEQSGVAAGNVTIDNAAKTVTYTSNTTGSSTITAVFAEAVSETFDLVTDVDDLEDGAEVVILNSGVAQAMAAQATNNRAASTAFTANGAKTQVTIEEGSAVRKFTLGTATGGYWTLYDAEEGGYLYAASSSSNHLKTQSTNNANGEWTISIASGGDATVTSHGSYSHNLMRYNGSSTIFACYESGQTAIKIFQKPTGPTISVTSALTTFSYNLNEGPSASQTFTVKGKNLTGNLTVTAPANYQVSLDGSSWANTQTLTATAGTVSSTTVYVRLIAGLAVNTYNGDITISGGGATSKNVTVNGEVVLDCSTPVVTFDNATVTKYKGDAKFTITPNVTGNILDAAVTYASSNTECATVDENTGEVTILKATATGTPVRITATLAEKSTSTTCTNEVSAYYDLTIYNRVTWYVNDAPYTTGDPTAYVAQNKPVTTLPTAPDGSSMCGGKTFVGWTDAPYAESNDAPAHLYKAANNFPNITDNASYYAVFAKEASAGSSGSYTVDFESTTDTYTNWTFGGMTTRKTDSNVPAHGGSYFGNTGALNPANLTTASKIASPTSIVFYVTKQTTNTTASFWVVQTSSNGTDWVDVGATQDAKSMTRGTWVEVSRDLSSKSDVYVRIHYEGTTANRCIDDVVLSYGSAATYKEYSTSCGAGISASDVGWITATKGEKVKREIAVSATNFDDPTTLSVSCANSHFNVSLAATDVPAGAAGLATTLTVEYTPADFGAREENVDIVLTAGDKTRTIKVSGRSLPEDFLMIVKKNDKWYALPANMTGGPGEYAGIEVAPNDNTTPTVVPVSPSTAIYHLASNAADRYETAGQCVRLVGMGELCLWSNMAEGATKVNIQNKISVSSASGVNYDWLLTTTDGIHYTVANPNHPLYASGRILSYGTKFGMDVEDAVFFFVSAGCTSQPDNVLVSPHRVDATFSWMCTAPSVTIDIYTNEAMTEGHLSATTTSAPYIFTGLAETTDYWYKLTPGTDTDCAVTGSFKTTGPSIDIVEWQQEAVILHIDKGDITPVIVIDGQEEHGSITGGGGTATELFFAKYFEGAGSMKLLSIFNGTNDAITLSGYKFVDRHAGSGASSFGSDVEYDLTSLGSINAGQEIIFFTRPKSTEVELSGCSTDFLNSVATKDKPTDNPRWIECASDKFADKAIEFNGNDAILLKKNGTIIDVIGALNKPGKGSNCSGEDAWEGTIKNMDKGKSPSDPVFDAFYETSSKSPVTKADSIALLAGFGINLSADEINISTARCIFFRDKRVTSGDSAVLMNAGDNFVTFTNHGAFISEWYGRSVCMTTAMKTAAGVTNDAQATCNSYQDIANMDYNEYYIDYTSHIEEGKTLDEFTSDPETKEYTIPIPDLVNYTCLNIRFQLKQGGNVVTEVAQQVPIMVDGSKTTSDALFSELVVDQSTHLPSYSHSVERCKTCDVVILGTGTLTKAADSDAKDVPEVGNVKVYPGGKLVVPSTTTNYTVKSLAFRRQEDAVSTANIEGNLTIGTDDAVYLDMRIDPTNWHYFTLPYDCKVEDIRFANPNETAVPTLGTDFLLKWYNGDKRAATQSTGCWEMVSPSATLKKGIGYIFALPGEGKERQEFRFPMSNDVVTEEKDTYKDAMGIYAYGGDKSMTEVRANHRGWNLIGNPYLLPYTSDITSPVMTGLIVEDHSEDDPQWNGHYTFDPAPATNLRYIVEPIANGWAGYEQVALSDYSMKPFTAYFVQVGGADPSDPQGVRFNLSRVNRSSIVARQAAEYEEDTHPVWCAVDLTNSKGEKDETTLLISDDFTDEYDMMDDLVKMRGTYYQYAQITTKPVLASRNNEGEMAFNALPDLSAKAGVPLHYFTAYGGEYTISYNNKYDRNNEVTEVKLLDTKTNEWYDLMAQAYTFTTNREDNKNRFYLSVGVERYNAPQVTTGCMQVRGDDTGGPRKILIDGHVYIQRGGAIYDITGKQMLNK